MKWVGFTLRSTSQLNQEGIKEPIWELFLCTVFFDGSQPHAMTRTLILTTSDINPTRIRNKASTVYMLWLNQINELHPHWSPPHTVGYKQVYDDLWPRGLVMSQP